MFDVDIYTFRNEFNINIKNGDCKNYYLILTLDYFYNNQYIKLPLFSFIVKQNNCYSPSLCHMLSKCDVSLLLETYDLYATFGKLELSLYDEYKFKDIMKEIDNEILKITNPDVLIIIQHFDKDLFNVVSNTIDTIDKIYKVQYMILDTECSNICLYKLINELMCLCNE